MKTTKDLYTDLNFFFKSKKPLIIEGEAGIGKTAIVEQFANDKNISIHKVLASSLDETDIAGIVVYDKETGYARTISPLLAKYAQEPCIIFLDEINTSRKEIQDTLLTLIQSRTFPNGDTIHKDVWFISAQNPALKYNNYEMSPAMKNRFAWLHYKVDEYNFANYLESKTEKKDLYSVFIQGLKDGKILFSTYDEDYNTYTSPRSICNLVESVDSMQELIEYAGAFVSRDTHLYLKTIHINDKPSIENEIFDKSFKGFMPKATTFIKK